MKCAWNEGRWIHAKIKMSKVKQSILNLLVIIPSPKQIIILIIDKGNFKIMYILFCSIFQATEPQGHTFPIWEKLLYKF